MCIYVYKPIDFNMNLSASRLTWISICILHLPLLCNFFMCKELRFYLTGSKIISVIIQQQQNCHNSTADSGGVEWDYATMEKVKLRLIKEPWCNRALAWKNDKKKWVCQSVAPEERKLNRSLSILDILHSLS